MPDQGMQEKTERATPRRREKAREEGRVARSTELNSAVSIIAGGLTLFFFGSYLSGHLQNLCRMAWGNAPFIAANNQSFVTVFIDNATRFFVILGPIFTVMILVAVGTNIAQVGFKISPKSIELKFDKLDIVKGLQKLVSMRSLVTLVRDTSKLFLIGFVAYKAMSAEYENFFLLSDLSPAQLAKSMGTMGLWITLKVGAAIFVLAILDYIYQKYEFEKSIKMSKQEIKDENKDTEGSPQIKSRVRQIQREMSRKRMMDDVPEADVVVTNPTHIAVALKYDQDAMSSPQIVAKGERLIARKIKEIALQHGIPIVEDKPLARGLFKACDIGDFVPDSLYRAVAEVLAYVYRLNRKEAN